MTYLTLLINGNYGAELEAAGNKIISVTGISDTCSVQMIINFQMIISTLGEININIIATITKLTQGLIFSQGLIIQKVSRK